MTATHAEEAKKQSISWFDVSFRDYLSYLGDKRFEEHTTENALALISHFTKIDEEELGQRSLSEIQMTHLAWVLLLAQPNDFDTFSKTLWDRTLEAIVFEKEVYLFPETVPNIITDEEQPLYEESFGNWLEAMQFTKYYSQLTDGGEMQAIPLIMALLFRKKDEVVPIAQVAREKWIARRKSIFERVNMYYIWQVLFFFIMPTVSLLVLSQTYLQQQNRREKQKSKSKQVSKL